MNAEIVVYAVLAGSAVGGVLVAIQLFLKKRGDAAVAREQTPPAPTPARQHTEHAPLPSADIERVRVHMGKHPLSAKCPCCEGTVWYVSGPVILSFGQECGPDGIILTGHAAPLVLLTCGDCSHTRTFSWRIARPSED